MIRPPQTRTPTHEGVLRSHLLLSALVLAALASSAGPAWSQETASQSQSRKPAASERDLAAVAPAADEVAQTPKPSLCASRAKLRTIVMPAAPPPVDPEDKAVRQARNRIYDRPTEPSLKDERPGVEVSIDGMPPGPFEPLPMTDSDVVLVGRVVSAQPYFSNYESRIYTEFTISGDSWIKASADVRANGTLTVTKLGGGITTPAGRKYVLNFNDNLEVLRVGARYLLFAEWHQSAKSGVVRQGYEIIQDAVCSIGYGGQDLDGTALTDVLARLTPMEKRP